MKKEKILADCRAALSIEADHLRDHLSERRQRDERAIEVGRELRAEGRDLRIVIYSWSDL